MKRLFRFVLITVAALTTFMFLSCSDQEVTKYKCTTTTFINGELYLETSEIQPMPYRCSCYYLDQWEYTTPQGDDVRIECNEFPVI